MSMNEATAPVEHALRNRKTMQMAEQLAQTLEKQQIISNRLTNLDQQVSNVFPTNLQKNSSIQSIRDSEENRQFMVRKKVDMMRRNLEQSERTTYVSNQELYGLFNDLQGMSQDLGISFQSPELVVCGMQSDGKSSLIEALLGFQFNIVETNIGTRRPLIIQMMNNKDCQSPVCRFRKEYPSPDEPQFEEKETAVRDLCNEIIRRTNNIAGIERNCVSDQPIILRVEYAHCATLTIFDTPGFRLGGDEKLRNEIEKMVIKLIAPKNRIIICLEQSTVESCNSTSRPFVQRVDPHFSRTILVNTKFDNRIKELRDKSSADEYLFGENLPEGVKPFFISLPVRRNMDSERYKDAIRESFLDDYEKLLEVEFDETRFLDRLGLFNLKKHLESVLRNEFQKALSPTLHALEEICLNTKNELDQVNQQLDNQNVELLMKRSHIFLHSFTKQIEELLHGSMLGHPEDLGQTLTEEKIDSGCPEWPSEIVFDFPNQNLKLYGGAQYARLMLEFQYIAHSRELPSANFSEIACALGTETRFGNTNGAAENLVSKKSKQILLPLVEILLQRAAHVMLRMFSVAIKLIREHHDEKEISILSEYRKFLQRLETRYSQFVKQLVQDCSRRLKDDFVMFSNVNDWDFHHSNTQSEISVDPEATKLRVENLMQKIILPEHPEGQAIKKLKLDEEGFQEISQQAAKLFSHIRFVFTNLVKHKMHSFFLQPMFDSMSKFIIDEFYSLSLTDYQNFFIDGVEEMKNLQKRLNHQLQLCVDQKDRFKEAYFKMASHINKD